MEFLRLQTSARIGHAHADIETIAMQAGGFVAEGRINGSLNLSRALGDMDYKQSKDLGPSAQVTYSWLSLAHAASGHTATHGCCLDLPCCGTAQRCSASGSQAKAPR